MVLRQSCSLDGVRTDQERAAEQFASYRPRLLGIAYRLLGSAWDAEDVVAEASIKWLHTDRADIREPAAYLTTVVTRLALDQLKSARAQRERYYGEWLPEPALTERGQLGPMETTAQRESLSFAMLRLMEQLTPLERAVFVLRTAFELPYDQVGGILGIKPPSARKLLSRAQSKLAHDGTRFVADAAQHVELFQEFLDATATGNLESLQQILALDIVAYNDGGGTVRAAPRPIAGRDNVIQFVAGLLQKYPLTEAVMVVEANGYPAAILKTAAQTQLVTLAVRDGLIYEIYAVLNPEKLGYTKFPRVRPRGRALKKE